MRIFQSHNINPMAPIYRAWLLIMANWKMAEGQFSLYDGVYVCPLECVLLDIYYTLKTYIFLLFN